MKTLIIHPDDPSTDFLRVIYEPIGEKTVITGGVTKSEIRDLIESHDRIMMMGHGCPYGLFAMGQFPGTAAYIVDYTMVHLLREKTDSVFIWCNADEFVNYFKLKGFYSGMFISEVGEAKYCGLPGTTQGIVDESNFGFCKIVSEHINEEVTVLHEKVKTEYGLIAEENPVALYNNKRIYLQ